MIPKKVWQCFRTKDVSSEIQALVERHKKQNPTWEFILWDDEDIREFIKKEYDEDMLVTFNSLTSGAGRADLWRYLVLFKYGGVYLDLDSEIVTPLDFWIFEQDECILTNEGCTQPLDHWPHPQVNRCMVQWALIYSAGHPFLEKTIERVVGNIKRKYCSNNLLKCTGPVAYTASVLECLFDDQCERSAKYRITARFDYDGHMNFVNEKVKSSMYTNEYWRNQQSHIK
jgi:mannosyltransferase OCH1-like enzyme